jgi:hypothetical protein
MTTNKVDEIKKNALKRAEFLREQAEAQGSASLYDQAAQYYYTAGKNYEANKCWDAADVLRKGEQ